MAVNNNENTAQRKPTFSGTKSLLSLGSQLGAPLSRNASGAALEGFDKTISEILQNADKSLKLSTIRLDNQSTGLVYSILLIKGEHAGHVAIYQLIVAGSAEARAPRIAKINNREFEIPVVAGDMYSAELQKKVVGMLQPHFGGKEIAEVGAAVLPADMDYTSIDEVRLIVHSATCAIADYLRNTAGQTDYFNAADYASAQFRARLVFNGGDTLDMTGNPQRTNFHLTLTGAERNHDSSIMQQETQLAVATGYLNLRYIGPQQVPTQFGGTQLTSQRLIPVINVTSTVVKQDVLTPELHLLSLALTTILGRNNAWEHAFRPVKTEDEFTQLLTNLAGTSSDLGVQIVTNDPANPFDVKTFLNTWVFQTPVYRMDIEECGPTTWLNEMIREACRGNPQAYAMVIETADRLTNGRFSTKFKAGTPIGAFEADRTVLGFFRDRKSVKRDLRSIDKLALDNMNPEDPTVGIEYERTFSDQYAPLDQRIAERIAILQRQLSGQLEITGYASSVLLNPEFMTALFQAVEEVGLRMQMDNAFDQAFVYDRNQSGLLGFGLNTQVLANQSVTGWGGANGYNPFSRFAGR